MDATRAFLQSIGLPPGDLNAVPASAKRFPDGAQYRVEIPSTEGPACLEAIVEEAERLQVVVHRVSQGSGVFLHTDEELDRMATIAIDARLEVSLFARPNAGWDASAMVRAPAGGVLAPVSRGEEQLVACLDDIRRAAEHGFRSVLIADIGVLAAFNAMRGAGELPADMQAKISVMLPVANPSTARVVEGLGANTINLPTDLTLGQIAAIRSVVDLPLDIYVESAAPVYLKFGLRNAPDVYPSGSHLEATAVALSRERVRRARLGLDLLRRAYPDAITSVRGAPGLALPLPVATP